MSRPIPLLLLGLPFLIQPTRLAAQLEVQIFLGSAASVPLPITIEQDGHPDIHFTARWGTRPTHPTWYYAGRLGYWWGDRGWRLDLTHHKLYLENPTPEVTELRITNGFNIVTLSRAFRSGRLTYSVGAGPVITYSFSTIRGREYQHDRGWKGYSLSGGSVMGMVSREFPLVYRFVATLDGRVSASYVQVPVRDGNARVPNVAAHLHVGLGYAIGGVK